MKNIIIMVIIIILIIIFLSFLIDNNFIPPDNEVILPVPAFNQMETTWCHFVSTSMILNYYGIKEYSVINGFTIDRPIKANILLNKLTSEKYKNIKNISNLKREFNQFLSYFRLNKFLKNYFNLKINFINIFQSNKSFLNDFVNIVRKNINQNRPLLLTYFYSLNESHTFVIIGYNKEGIVINNPSMYMIDILEERKEKEEKESSYDIKIDENLDYIMRLYYCFRGEYYFNEIFLDFLKNNSYYERFFVYIAWPLMKYFLDRDFYNCQPLYTIKWEDLIYMKNDSWFILPFVITEMIPKNNLVVNDSSFNLDICSFGIYYKNDDYVSYPYEFNRFGYRLKYKELDHAPLNLTNDKSIYKFEGSIFLLKKPEFLYSLKLVIKFYDNNMNLINEKEEEINLIRKESQKINFRVYYEDLNNFSDEDLYIIFELRDIFNNILSNDFLIVPKNLDELID